MTVSTTTTTTAVTVTAASFCPVGYQAPLQARCYIRLNHDLIYVYVHVFVFVFVYVYVFVCVRSRYV